MAHSITGRVHEIESDLGVPELHVTALLLRDLDGKSICCGAAGTATTDDRGRFAIESCSEHIDPGAEVVVEVRSSDRESVLATARQRHRPDDRHFFDIAISRGRLANDSPADLPRPGRKPERARVKLTDEEGNTLSGPKILLLTEHASNQKHQRRVIVDGDDDFEVDVPPGDYTVQAFAKGYGVGRGLARVEPGGTLDMSFPLERVPADRWKRTDDQRIAEYDLSAEQLDLQPLTVDSGETIKLDGKSKTQFTGVVDLVAKDIDQLKRFIGSKDIAFNHDAPRFGRLPIATAELTKKRTRKEEFTTASADVKQDLEMIAHEYTHGNAESVQQYQPVLDSYIAAAFPDGLAVLSFFFSIVTIHADAILEVGGGGSTVFFASVLRIHPTGSLMVVGDCKLDIGRWENF